ncbi:hemopexin-like [Osmerus eperlanus]|uniref:hemopexin-like n=1 Tax=Osmerus eperlanus TaxID=29151 RepID=UPI002E13B4D5
MTILLLLRGQTVYDTDLMASPRVPVKDASFTLFKKVDEGMCGPDGVKVIVGHHYDHFESVKVMLMARVFPEQHRVSLELFGCDH